MDTAASQVRRRRWPTEVEWARRDAVEAIETAIRELEANIQALEAQRLTTPPSAQTWLADAIRRDALALAALQKALRLLAEAKHGQE